MLQKRLVASALLVVPVLGLFWLDTNRNFGLPGVWLTPLALLFGLLIASELLGMLKGRTVGATDWVAYVGTAGTILAAIVPELFQLPADCPVGRWGWVGIALACTLVAAFLHEFAYFSEDRSSTERIALTIFTVMYAGWLLSFLLATRLFLGNSLGATAVVSVICITKLSDAGAYFVGKTFGRKKMAPILSPNKTVEGLLGGIVAALLTAAILFGWLLPMILSSFQVPSWWAILGYGLTISLAGVLGDLCESLLKRDLKRKDSSGWLPGLGGIMDTSDSILMASPIAFLWWTTGLLGG